MRTTWNINEDVVEKLKEYAAARSISAGKAAVRSAEARHCNAEVPTKCENGILRFSPFRTGDGHGMSTY